MERIENKINPYGSHLAFLRMIFKAHEIKSVLEFGMGENSTPFFLSQNIESLDSIEQQDEKWFIKMLKLHVNNNNWGHQYLPYPKKIKYTSDLYDLVFVDGHHYSRADDVNYAFHKAPLIVAHDFEKTKYYQWHNIQMPEDYRLFTYTENGKQTALFAHISVL